MWAFCNLESRGFPFHGWDIIFNTWDEISPYSLYSDLDLGAHI